MASTNLGDLQLGNAQLGDDGNPGPGTPPGAAPSGDQTKPATPGAAQLGGMQLGVAASFATFALDNQVADATGTLHIIATGLGTTWISSSNPFSIVSGAASNLRNYVWTSATHAEFDITVDYLIGADIVIADANSGTTQTVGTTRAATIYYVDAIAGDDSKTGIVGSPWQTVAKVNAWGQIDGDSVLFAAGQTFDTDEALILRTGVTYSTTARGIFIEQHNPATINVTSDVDGASGPDAERLTLDNLILDGLGTDIGTGYTDSTCKGLNLKSTQTSTKLQDVTIQACTFTGFMDGAWAWVQQTTHHGYNNLLFKFCTFHGNQRVGGIVFHFDPQNPGFATGTKTQFTNVTFERCHSYDQTGNVASGAQGSGIDIRNTTTGAIRFCVSHDIDAVGASNLVGGASGIGCIRSSGVTIEDCEVYHVKAPDGVDGVGIDVEIDVDNIVVQRNFCHHNDGAGFTTGGAYGEPASAVWRYNVSIANVIVTTTQAEFYTFGLGSIPGGTIDITAYGNLFYGTNGRSFALGADNAAHTVKLYNNIFIAPNTKKNIEGITTAASAEAIGNLYWRPDGTVNVDGITSLAALRAAGFEKIGGTNYGVIADPLLHAPGSVSATGTLPDSDVRTLDYFDLDEGSPAIAVGILLSDVSISDVGRTDFRGVAIPVGRPNIGPVLIAPLPSLNSFWRTVYMREYERRYGVATYVDISMLKKGVSDFALGADWTPLDGDVKISKDGGAAANIATLPFAIAMGNTAYWRFPISASEGQASCFVVTVSDSATKVVEDNQFSVTTYGHPSALDTVDPITGSQLYATSATGSTSTTTAIPNLNMTAADAIGTTIMLYTSVGVPVWSRLIDSWDNSGKIATHRTVGTTAGSTNFVAHVLTPKATTDTANLPGVSLDAVLGETFEAGVTTSTKSYG